MDEYLDLEAESSDGEGGSKDDDADDDAAGLGDAPEVVGGEDEHTRSPLAKRRQMGRVEPSRKREDSTVV